jgi:hypothetical protein
LTSRPQAGHAALIALVGFKEEIDAEGYFQIEYLRQLAKSRGLDFFCNQEGWEQLESSKPTFLRGHNSTMARHDIFSHHASWITGGINE